MAFLQSLNISASGLTAQRLRMDVIAENIANIDTTRTESGTAYRRRYVVFEERAPVGSFRMALTNAANKLAGSGVRVSYMGEDQSDFKMEYDPTHPDADADGYVARPNVDLAQEMVDFMSAYRSYEANITAFNAMKDMAMKTLEIGR